MVKSGSRRTHVWLSQSLRQRICIRPYEEGASVPSLGLLVLIVSYEVEEGWRFVLIIDGQDMSYSTWHGVRITDVCTCTE